MLERARLAVESRAHLLLRYDPSADGLFGLRASLAGNPAPDENWGEANFAEWAAGETRFADQLEPAGEGGGGLPLDDWLELSEQAKSGARPVSEIDGRRYFVKEPLARACAERLAIWQTLQELTGERSPFTERIRGALTQERDTGEKARHDALEAEHVARLAESPGGRAGRGARASRRATPQPGGLWRRRRSAG